MTISKSDRVDRVSKKAGDYEELYINCAQGTLQALQEEFGLGGGDDVVKAAAWMPGLVARGESCGAFIGGLMALGLAFSPDKLCSPLDLTPEESKKQWEYKQKVFRFSKEFEKEYGSTLCNDIHPQVTGKSYDFMNLDDLQQFVLDDGAKKCRVPPEKAARIIAEILLEK